MVVTWSANHTPPCGGFGDITTEMVDMRLKLNCTDLIHGNGSTDCLKTNRQVNIVIPAIMGTIGAVGNVLALVVLYRTRKDVRKSIFYNLVAALAWTDLLSQVLTTPVSMLSYVNNLEWVGGQPLCRFNAFTMISFGLITPLIVALMAVERLLGLRYTYFHTVHASRTKAKVSVLSLWLFVILFSILPLVGFGKYELQYPRSWCFLKFHFSKDYDAMAWRNEAGYSLLYASLNLVVMFVTLVCNLIVIYTVLRMRKRRRGMHSPAEDRRTASQRERVDAEIQMVILLVGMTLVFTFCWTPIMLRIIISIVKGETHHSKADLAAVRAAAINQILDPWVYILLRRSMFIRLYRLCCRKGQGQLNRRCDIYNGRRLAATFHGARRYSDVSGRSFKALVKFQSEPPRPIADGRLPFNNQSWPLGANGRNAAQ